MNAKPNFTEENIRPQRFNEGKAEAAAEDIRYLLSRAHDFVEVSCPACDSAACHLELVKEEFSYMKCVECSTVYMSPRPSCNLLADFYRRSKLYEYWNSHIFPSSELSRKEKIFIPRVDRTVEISKKYLSKFESFLEVGAGYGTFSEELKSRGLFDNIHSLELTPALAKTCRKKGLNVIELAIEEMSSCDCYDAIAAFETLEHLFSPRNFLKSCLKMLKLGGILFMSMPSYSGFDIRVLGIDSSSIDHEHINLFNPKSISRLLEDEGFQILELFTPGELDVDIVRNKLEGGLKLDNSFLQTIVMSDDEDLRNNFQCFLKDNSLSSHMWVVGRKT